jgi:hypothetical protein
VRELFLGRDVVEQCLRLAFVSPALRVGVLPPVNHQSPVRSCGEFLLRLTARATCSGSRLEYRVPCPARKTKGRTRGGARRVGATLHADPRGRGSEHAGHVCPPPPCRTVTKKDARLAGCVLVQPNRRISAGGEAATVKPAQLHRAEQCAEDDQRPFGGFGDGTDRAIECKIIHAESSSCRRCAPAI